MKLETRNPKLETRNSPVGPPPAGLQAVLFDLGGTLIDYLGGAPSWPAMEVPGVEALHACLVAAGFPLDARAFHGNFIQAMDRHWREATEALAEPPTLDGLIGEVCVQAGFALPEELRRKAVASYCMPIAQRATVREGALQVLQWLHRHGVRLGLISNSLWPGSAHRLDLERFGLLCYFDQVLFSSECGLWKPDPRVFQVALGELGAVPERSAFVGDRLMEDIQGARRSGLRGIFLEGTEDYPDADPQKFPPDARIQRLTELPSALAALWA